MTAHVRVKATDADRSTDSGLGRKNSSSVSAGPSHIKEEVMVTVNGLVNQKSGRLLPSCKPPIMFSLMKKNRDVRFKN